MTPQFIRQNAFTVTQKSSESAAGKVRSDRIVSVEGVDADEQLEMGGDTRGRNRCWQSKLGILAMVDGRSLDAAHVEFRGSRETT